MGPCGSHLPWWAAPSRWSRSSRRAYRGARACARPPNTGEFAARLTNGRCADFGAAFKSDASGPAPRDNDVWLDLRTAGRGEAGDRIRVHPLPSGHLFSVVHAHGNADPGDRVACDDLKPD
jgi:hypothetical protein